jgi:hypothetical protein
MSWLSKLVGRFYRICFGSEGWLRLLEVTLLGRRNVRVRFGWFGFVTLTSLPAEVYTF